jgi:hypothetical protein
MVRPLVWIFAGCYGSGIESCDYLRRLEDAHTAREGTRRKAA